jgi:hypothetical protein
MEKQKVKKGLVVYGVLAYGLAAVFIGAFIWKTANLTDLLLGGRDRLAQLRGAVDCNCKTCTDDSTVFNECWHLNPTTGTLEDHLDPNGTPPEPPGPGDPNPHDDPNQYRGCSPDYCIKNTIYFAECPEMANGAGCPTKSDYSKWWVEQEIKTGAPDDCSDPNYTVVDAFSPTDCKKYGSSDPPRGSCEVSTCEGEAVSNTWDDDNDPNTPEKEWYTKTRTPRTVCNVTP